MTFHGFLGPNPRLTPVDEGSYTPYTLDGAVGFPILGHQRALVASILDVGVVDPPSSVIAAFDQRVDGLLARTFECRRETCTLTNLRDTLLPKPISGECCV
ncbi:MAG: hypothetical protein AW09_004524 [Candidatus Accumulibacter phosphatis]|uniref:Uncharacterized protein n=1 Tax=Candidatus Accumulibacter phosphatis TaxID=327160 RepID=A0A084Y6P0_9PROT|nr:MAG: hypothetical protein AW09_004524 [Candidatus Accumulibacter phosphatis]